MNYFNLLETTGKGKAKVGILGSNGAFGYSFLAQLPSVSEHIELRLVCDLNPNQTCEILATLGYKASDIVVCETAQQMQAAPKDAILVTKGCELAPLSDVDVIVEATGSPELSSINAEQCLLHDKHVCIVSKEADCISGPYLYELAKQRGLVYAITIGDQPANLIDFHSWVQTLGLEIIAAGKSSEYDFIYDLDSQMFSFCGKEEYLPELREYWAYTGPSTLKERSRVLHGYPQCAVPDYCEMNIVSNATGLVPSCDALHYPICNVSELAEIYVPVEDGGILEKTGVVDVFNNLRRPDEASFAGGVFVIVKCTNDKVWELLAEKGHVVSKSRKYAALYLPYHFMGVEAPMSVILAHYLGHSSYHQCKRQSVMTCRTKRDFKKGEVLALKTHHRVIQDMEVSLQLAKDVSSDVAPYYLMAGMTLKTDIPKGTIVTQDMLELGNSQLKRMMQSN